jgi:uncharacterized protein YdiU (UPF0061 family)
MLRKLGLEDEITPEGDELLRATIQILDETQVGYHQFFSELSQIFNHKWVNDLNLILTETELMPAVTKVSSYNNWLQLYHRVLNHISPEDRSRICQVMAQSNPQIVPLRPNIEAVWEPITQEDNWQPFYDFVNSLRGS